MEYGASRVSAVTKLIPGVAQGNGQLAVCSESGLACDACVSGTARQLAQVCKGLNGKMVGQLFVQIYAEPACARMHGVFAEAYREAAADLTERPSPVIAPACPTYQRREVTSSRPRAMAAVA